MLKLNSAHVLEAVMGGAIISTAPTCVVGYTDKAVGGGTYDGDPKLTDLTGVTAAVICAAPAASTSRHVDYLSLRNNDSVSQVFTVRYNQSATLTTLIMATLAAGEMLGFTHSNGWYVNTADGSRKSGAVQDLSTYATTAAVAAGYQPLDTDLTVVAALAPNNDDILQRKAGAWTARSPAQVKTDLALGKSDVGLGNVDNTSDANKPVSTAQAAADASVLSTANAHADSLVTAILDDRGGFDASGNVFPSTGGRGAAGAILKGDLWTISIAGTLGGQDVGIGDVVRALADTPGQTAGNWTITEHNFGYVAENSANKNASGGYAGLALFKLNLVNALGTITSFFTTAATVARTWTMPDKDGTVAMTSDISDATISLTDITTNNSSTSAHGFLKKLSNAAGEFMNGVGNWVAAAALATANTFTAAQRGAISALTDASTVAINLALANQYSLVLGGSRTLGVPTNIVAGQQGTISVRQDATGSRTLAYAWPYVWAGGTAGVLSTPGCTRDLLGYSVDAYNSGVVTITIASPGVVSMTAHGFDTGQRVQITTTGALPTGLTASTTYFVSKVDADSFKLCTSLVNAAAGTFINTSGSQSGVHTLVGCTISLNLSKAFA